MTMLEIKNFVSNVFADLVGGALGAGFGFFSREIREWFRYRNFKKVFGRDAANFSIVYGKMKLRSPLFDESGNLIEWPYFKLGTNKIFNVSEVTSVASARSISYISRSFGQRHAAVNLVSDEEAKGKLDFSFCSIGGLNNLKTVEVLSSEENVFYKFGPKVKSIVSKHDGTQFTIGNNYDYALIVKLTPGLFPNRTWMVVAGLGEWGTSGAVWFLSKKWKELPKRKSFGVIIRVKGGQDESGEIVDQIY